MAILVKRWCRDKGFECPDQSFFDELRSEFSRHMKTMFPNFNFVSEWEMKEGFWQFLSKNKLPLVSLERVYDEKTLDKFRLDCCRGEGCDGSESGLMARSGFPHLWDQLNRLESIFKYKEIALWDDVAYTGSSIMGVIKLLKEHQISVKKLFLGIGVQTVDGLRGGCMKLGKAGILVQCRCKYDCVIDQVCERDFYPGILFSGRSVRGDENFSRPYLLPWGNPHRWASIPEKDERKLSRFCIGLTIGLFEEIERLSGRKVYARDLVRKIFHHYPKGKVSFPKNSVRHVDALKRALEIVN